MIDQQPIGIFDSGVGGLTVLHAIEQRLPAEDLIYLGDTARLPYGTKSGETIVRYALQGSAALVSRGIKLLVLACNTASAHALGAVQAAYPQLPVIGVIEPGARAALAAAPSGRIAVLATEGTVQSGAYERALVSLCPTAQVQSIAASLLVALAEEGWTSGVEAQAVLRRYLAPVLAQKPEALLLGCTHFPLLIPALRELVGPQLGVVDSASTTAAAVHEHLAHHQACRSGSGRLRLLATDGASRFARVAGQFLGRTIASADIEIINL